MKSSINRAIKIVSLFGLAIIVGIVGLAAYHLLWFQEYYRWPPVSFVEVRSDQTKLIDGIESYQSIEEFNNYLRRMSLQWEVKTSPGPSGKSRPPFNITTVTIKNYLHLSISGELQVIFFNNRLAATLFFPSDLEKHIKALQKQGITFNGNREVEIRPHTIIRSGQEFTGRHYIDWLDVRLDREMSLWIKRYS